MGEEQSSSQTRRMIFLLMGLSDSIIGAVLLLIWIGFLPVDLAQLDMPRWVAGVVGAALFFPGIAVVTYQLTKTIRPE